MPANWPTVLQIAAEVPVIMTETGENDLPGTVGAPFASQVFACLSPSSSSPALSPLKFYCSSSLGQTNTDSPTWVGLGTCGKIPLMSSLKM